MEIKKLKECLQFFKVHKLFGGVDRLYEMHIEFIEKANKMIKEAKQYHSLDQESQSIMQLTQQMFTHQNNRDFTELVNTMFTLLNTMSSVTAN